MAKAFFIGMILLVVGGIGVYFLDGLGLLPTPVYSFFYEVEMRTPFLHGYINPSLQKFEGNWHIELEPSSARGADIAACTTLRGRLRAHNGVFSGTIGPLGAVLRFTATTTDAGIMSGVFGGTTLHIGEVHAILGAGEGTGTWSDNYGCNGDLQLTKQDPITDPVAGKVVSVQGDAILHRNGEERILLPGVLLYEEDVITTAIGSVLLGLGNEFDTPATVPANSSYKVPR
jgi:hypothetical protein